MISIFALLLLLGIGGAALALIVFALTQGRPGIAALIGGLLFFAFLICLAAGWMYIKMESHDVAIRTQAPLWAGGPMNDAARAAAQGIQEFKVSIGERSSAPSPVSFFKLLVLVAVACVVAVIVFRRLTLPTAACGRRRIWPALLAIPLIAVLLLGTMRVRMSSDSAATIELAPQIAAWDAQQAALAHAQMAAQQYQGVIPQADIHGQMDQFDGPRISIAPSPPPADQPETAPRPDQPASKSGASDKAKPSTASNPKRNKPATTPAGSESKTTHAVAQSKSAEESTGANDKAAGDEKNSPLAEAMPAKPAARPAWVNEAPRRTGNNRREVIATDEYATVDECYQAADVFLLLKAYQYMQQVAGRPYVNTALPSLTFHSGMILADGNIISHGRGTSYWTDARLRDLSSMGIGADYVRRELVAKDPKNNEPREYVETTDHSSVGPMKKLYLQIEFTPAVERNLRQRWDAQQRQERFAMVGGGAGFILGLLSLVFATLKLDTWTKGYYSKRLFVGVPLAILGMFGLYAMLVEMGFKLPH